jgi:molybdate transport system substrate-binding protein
MRPWLNCMISGGIQSRVKWLKTIFVAGILIASQSFAAEVRVFAAASLTDALKQIAIDYEKKTGDKIVFNFGASSFLARQIEEGAPADIFFSADEGWMNELEKKNLIVKETRRSPLSNSLVIVIANDSALKITAPRDLAASSFQKIALADPSTVPAGKYAKEYLESFGIWNSVSRKVVPTDNVRAALAAVESGNVDAGIVYKTDAAISKKTKVVMEIPRSEGPKISYPIALLTDAKNVKAANDFLIFLRGQEAAGVFRKFEFVVNE